MYKKIDSSLKVTEREELISKFWGASITAIDGGKCVDTSMGLTPLEGIPMGTRSGNIDPTVVSYICEKEGKDAKTVVNELNKISGYLGVSCYSNDARDLEEKYHEGDKLSRLALEIQDKRIVDYIGSYYFLLGRVDAIIFTAGIGEVSYAIGIEKPVSLYVDTFNTSKIKGEEIVEIIKKEFDLTPSGIIRTLNLRTPIYKNTSCYGHFGREEKGFPWENLDKVDDLRKYLK